MVTQVPIRAATHPAMALRAGHARLTGTIPSLIVCGGDEESRELTADLYVWSLVRTGALSQRKAGRVARFREEGLPDRGTAEHRALMNCPLLVLGEAGTVVREDTPGADPAGWPVDRAGLGRATVALIELLLARGEHHPTVVTTPLHLGNPPLTADDLDHACANYALHKAVEERGRAGWPVPSPVAGFDPDSRIAAAGVPTLREHLGEHVVAPVSARPGHRH